MSKCVEYQKPIARRGLFAMALAGALSGCAQQVAPVVSPPPPAPTPEPGVVDYLAGIASGVLGIAGKLGLDAGTVATLQSLAGRLAAIASAVTAPGGSALLAEAAGIVQKLLPLLSLAGGPAGGIVAAISSLLPLIASFTGLRTNARTAGPAMPPAAAMAVLHRAAAGAL